MKKEVALLVFLGDCTPTLFFTDGVGQGVSLQGIRDSEAAKNLIYLLKKRDKYTLFDTEEDSGRKGKISCEQLMQAMQEFIENSFFQLIYNTTHL